MFCVRYLNKIESRETTIKAVSQIEFFGADVPKVGPRKSERPKRNSEIEVKASRKLVLRGTSSKIDFPKRAAR